MTASQQHTRWYYTLNYYVPATYPGKDGISWILESRHCEILLPCDAEDPAEFLRQEGYSDARDEVSYADFTTTPDWL
jgi:hypothetical protein